MKKLKIYLLTKFNNWIIAHFVKLKPTKVISDLYRNQANEDLNLTTRVIEVKKGKIKYCLMLVMTKDCKVKFNLGKL